jgi:hypothetical protein
VLPDGDEDFLDAMGKASYSGLVRGTAGNTDPLTGTVQLDVSFHSVGWDVNGTLDFDGGDSVGIGGLYSSGMFGGWVLGGAFEGGTIDAATSEVTADMYGPNAEEVGGTWAFVVDGGDHPGRASGEFVGKR